MKKMMVLVMGLVVMGMFGMAYGLEMESFEISCTPSVSYSVTISTPEGGLTFTGVEPGQTYVNQTTATVVNSGNVSADWKIKGTALSNWTFAGEPGSNAARLLVALKASIASSGDFDVVNDTITANESNMDATKYSVDQNGNNVAASASRLLSVRLDSPTDTDYDTAQKFRIDIKAYPASTF